LKKLDLKKKLLASIKMTLTSSSEEKVDSIYISAGCNRCARALDWGGKCNQLIYAQCNSVALLSRTEPFSIKYTFNRHSDKVNCVKWISRVGIDGSAVSTDEFISGSKDKSIIVWQQNTSNGSLVGFFTFSHPLIYLEFRFCFSNVFLSNFKYDALQVLQGHTDSVGVLDAMYFKTNSTDPSQTLTHLASASVDSTIRIWTRSTLNGQFTQDQILHSKQNGFALALKFYTLPISNCINYLKFQVALLNLVF
jgi:WD40 repeat protein